MTLAEIKISIKQLLSKKVEAIELNSLLGMLIEEVTGWNRVQQVVEKNTPLTEAQIKKFNEYSQALLNDKPIQYILGKAWFMGVEYTVNEAVLIPRPETEELVEWVVDYANIIGKPLQVLDIGTGSGCIAIALKKALASCSVTGLDISAAALAVAKKNAAQLNANIEWIEQDILNNVILPTTYDVLVSNPPYIPMREKENMQEQVKNQEPAIALFVPNEDPLLFYRTIAQLAKKQLAPKGQLFFEIHYDQGKAILHLLDEMHFHAEIRRDSFGKNRMIRASLK
ncbi:MAG: peptide chain release factor N(5)-glutamine methyltransferase [Chitinophagia bacterium]|jgi:release factor glutamine methyltransferase